MLFDANEIENAIHARLAAVCHNHARKQPVCKYVDQI